ncbi:MAG: hypothetical protein GY722_15850 [bacterium]|nr:hypothetical protein [bacterium]
MKKRRKRGWPPKGAYPHPKGGYILEMEPKPGDRIRVIGHQREEPDLEALAKAVVELAYELEKRKRNNNQS